MEKINNFIPNPSGQVKRRPGFQHIPFRPRNLWGRFVRWWRGDPQVISQMITYGQPPFLYVATDKGLFYMDEKSQVLKPVSFTESTGGK